MAHLAGSDHRWQDEHVWTNSWFGRTVCTAFGLFVLGLALTDTWEGGQILVDVVFCVVGATVLVAVWTSRLVLVGGTLTATNLFRACSMPLAEVDAVTWSWVPFLGGRLRRADGSGIRTLVSGKAWDEPWTPRATKIEREILGLAHAARHDR